MTAKPAILAVGVVDVGGIARSGRAAGYKVYTIDYFGDLDVRRHSERSLSILREGRRYSRRSIPKVLLELMRELTSRSQIDYALLASGLDDEHDLLRSIHDLTPIMGNPPEVIQRVRDKMSFFKDLKRMAIPFPLTLMACSFKEGLTASKEVGFPLVIKPPEGYGGRRVVKVGSKRGLKRFFKKTSSRWLIQEYIPGTPASISVIANGSSVRVLSLNEQLLGRREFGKRGGFTYCGNIVPLNAGKDLRRMCDDVAGRIVAHFGLKGSNGVDLVLSKNGEKLNVVEVNPRFQGSMECIERHLNINLVKEHMRVCQRRELPSTVYGYRSEYYARAILFAKTSYITPDLFSYDFVRDIPWPGRRISRGDPICSVVGCSYDRNRCFLEVKHLAEMIYSLGRFG